MTISLNIIQVEGSFGVYAKLSSSERAENISRLVTYCKCYFF